jgi:hypothetical protein
MGRQRYFEELKRNGSFFMTPGFVNHRESMIRKIEDRSSKPYSNSYIRIMLEANEYKRALIVEEGIETDEYYERVKRLADDYGLPIERTSGDLDLLEYTVYSAIDSLIC